MSRAGRTALTRARLAAVAVTAGHDVLVYRLRDPAAVAAVRYAAAAAVLGIARRAGVSWGGLGLDRGRAGSGLRTGAVSGAGVCAAVALAAALPAGRPFFRDERAAAAGGRSRLAAGLARITLAAVPPEEITYRGALLGLWLADGPLAAVAWSGALFGLSHILPTVSTMSQTAVSHQLARGALRQVLFVGGNVVVTGLAGTGFAWLRLRSGSILAPLIAHAALNDAALVAGHTAHRAGATADRRARDRGLSVPPGQDG